jgi:cell division protein FtsQ
MLFLVIFLTAFSTFKNGERKIDLNTINYLDSNFNFISVESVNKLLKQSDSISLNLLKRDLNLKEIERIINENTFIDSAEVSLSLDGEIGVKIVEKEPVFRVLSDKYYIDSRGNKMPLSKIFSKVVPLIISDVDSTYLKDLGLLGNYIKNDIFFKDHISGLEIIENEIYFYVNGYSYQIKIKDLEEFETSFMNYKAFFKSVEKDSVLTQLSSINLNFKNQVIVQKK